MTIPTRIALLFATLLLVATIVVASLALLNTGSTQAGLKHQAHALAAQQHTLTVQAASNCQYAQDNRNELVAVVKHLESLVPPTIANTPDAQRFLSFVHDEERIASKPVHCTK